MDNYLEMKKIPRWKIKYIRHLFKRRKMFNVFSIFDVIDRLWKRTVLKFAFYVWYED